jgi:hypothetical protein
MATTLHGKVNIPVLTDAVGEPAPDTEGPATAPDEPVSSAAAEADNIDGATEALIAELQTILAARTFALTEDVIRTAFHEMEAKLHEQITSRLRSQLPELIDSLLREQLGVDRDPD